MKNNIEKVYGKLPKKKVDLKKHKIDLALLNDFEYTSQFTNEIIGSLDYTVNNWFDEKFDQMMEIYNEIYDVYVNNSENYLKVVDIANDQRVLGEILTRANDLGIEVADVYPEWYEHSDALEYLNGLESKFNSQKDSLPNF